MKRKFIQFLMLAAVAVTMGTFVACKDVSDDMFVELQNEINELRLKISDEASLRDALSRRADDLQDQIDELDDLLGQIQGCTCDPTAMQRLIDALTERLDALDGGVTGGSAGSVIETIQDAIDRYQTSISMIETAQGQMNSTITTIQNQITEILNSQYDDTEIISRITQVEQSMLTVQSTLTTVQTAAQNAQTAAAAANALAQQALTAAQQASSDAAEAKGVADAAKALAEQTESVANAAKTLAESNKGRLDAIDGVLTTIQGELAQVAKTASDALALSEYDSIQIDLLKADNELIKSSVEDLKAVVNSKVDSLATVTNRLEDKVNTFGNKVDSLAAVSAVVRDSVRILNEKFENLMSTRLQQMSDSIAANAKNVGELRAASEKADSLLQDQIDELKGQYDALKTQVDKNAADIQALAGDIAALKEAIARQITGIEIQKVTNPWFGSFSTPFDISSNVLIAFYGDASNPIFFPSPAGYGPYATVSGNVELSEKDMEMIALCNPSLAVDESNPYIKAGRPLFNRPTGRADGGEVYVTVNPNGLDCSGVQLELVNTAHGTSGFNLTPLASTSDVLEFGWTRAGGLYKAGAYVDAATLNKVDKVDIDMDAAKNAAGTLKDMVKESLDNNTVAASKTDLFSLASDMNKVVQSARLNKTLLRAPWTDVNGNQNYTSSRADIAATAVKPLSFETFKDVNVETVPGFERANTLLDRVSNSLQNNVNLVFKKINGSPIVTDIRAINIKKIEIEDLTPEQLALFSVTIDTTFVIDGLKYFLNLSETVNVPVKFSQDVTVPIDIEQEIAIDLSNIEVNTPTIVVSTAIKNSDGSAKLLVPVTMDPNDPASPVLGYAEVPLDMVKVDATAGFGEDGKITLDGQAVANLSYHDNKTVTISVDQTVSTTVNVQKWVYFGDYKLDSEGNPVYVGEGNGDAKTFRILITRDLSDAAESLWGTAQGSLGSVNEMLEQVEKVLEDVNDMLDDINKYNTAINNKIEHYIDKVKDYLQNVNDKLANIINSVNSRLQPVMFASDDSGIKNLSQTKNYPTKFAGTTLTLTPTTWTMELAVPVCRKHVAVTNVFKGDKSAQGGDAACLTALKAANAGGKNINERLDGQTHDLSLAGLKAGYVYELAYSALDYHGKIATRKFYLTVQ